MKRLRFGFASHIVSRIDFIKGEGVAMVLYTTACLRFLWAARRFVTTFITVGLLLITAGLATAQTGKEKPPTVARQQSRDDRRPLIIGKTVKRDIAAGQLHSYIVTLAAEQFLKAVIEPQGVSLRVALIAPDGKRIAESLLEARAKGRQSLLALSASAGLYKLEIALSKKEAGNGAYLLSVAEVRGATAEDRRRVAAGNLLREAAALRIEGTQQALQNALEKQQQALALWQKSGERHAEALTLADLGDTHLQLNEHPQALIYYNQALQLLRTLGDRGWDAFVANGRAEMYKVRGGIPQTAEYLVEALPLLQAREARFWRAVLLTGIGAVYSDMDDHQQALAYFRQALAVRKENADRYGEAMVLHYLGKLYEKMGDSEQALKYYGDALTIFRDLGGRGGEEIQINLISYIFLLGDKQKTLTVLTQALPFLKAARAYSLQAVVLDGLSQTYFELGEIQKTLEYAEQARTLYHNAEDRRGELSALNQKAKVYALLGEDQKVVETYREAVTIFKTVGDRVGEAIALTSLGDTAQKTGDRHQALDYFKQALTLTREAGDREEEYRVLSSIGRLYHRGGELQKALDYYAQALSLSRLVKDRTGEGFTLNSIGTIYHDRGAASTALRYYQQALALERQESNRYGEAFTLQLIGKTYGDCRNRRKALEAYQQALTLARAMGDQYDEAAMLYQIAQLQGDAGQLSEARTHIETAIQITESLRGRILSQELRTSYFATVQEYQNFHIDLLMQLHRRDSSKGYEALALHVSERARARSLLELLAEARADIRQGVDEQLLARERTLQQLLAIKAEQSMQLLKGNSAAEQKTDLQKEIDNLTAEFQQVQAKIRATSPRYAAMTQPQPLRLEEIQKQVLDDDTVLLEYLLGRKRSYLWVVSQTAIASFELPGSATIEAQARQVYQTLTARNLPAQSGESSSQRKARIEKLTAEFPVAAIKLSATVLAPAAALLTGKRLLVVADGALQYIPFAALPEPMAQRGENRNPSPLMVNHEIVSLPSASTIAVLRSEQANRQAAPKAIAILADPVFDKDDERVRAAVNFKKSANLPLPDNQPQGKQQSESFVKKSSAASASAEEQSETRLLIRRKKRFTNSGAASYFFPRLPFTRQEAERILALQTAGDAITALDFDANKTTATSAALSQYRYLHFASHGYIDTENPELSAIVLSLIDRQGKPQSGFLRAMEIFNLNLPAEMVVLSACETGLGKEIKGEGVVGLTRGFMYAGAARVTVSLWSVHDRATADLMEKLYQKMLQQKLTAAAALRAAQIEMWQTKRWQEPYYWAPFIIQGEWR